MWEDTYTNYTDTTIVDSYIDNNWNKRAMMAMDRSPDSVSLQNEFDLISGQLNKT